MLLYLLVWLMPHACDYMRRRRGSRWIYKRVYILVYNKEMILFSEQNVSVSRVSSVCTSLLFQNVTRLRLVEASLNKTPNTSYMESIVRKWNTALVLSPLMKYTPFFKKIGSQRTKNKLWGIIYFVGVGEHNR